MYYSTNPGKVKHFSEKSKFDLCGDLRYTVIKRFMRIRIIILLCCYRRKVIVCIEF